MGCPDDGYILPELVEESLDVDASHALDGEGFLFASAVTLTDQRLVRRRTAGQRADRIAEAIEREPSEAAIVWCDYNAEAAEILSRIPDAVEVSGPMDPDEKARRLLAFADGEIRILVTKPKIAGFGMNWQHCGRVYFFGPTHSHEQRYQAIRRCWRSGRTAPVIVRTCEAPEEHAVVDSMRGKERLAAEMLDEVVAAGRENAAVSPRWEAYEPTMKLEVPKWML